MILQRNILMLLLLAEARPILDIPLAAHMTRPFFVQSKAENTLPSSQVLPAQPDRPMPHRKGAAGFYKQGCFSLH